jgi:hypothetical protein
MEIALAVVLIVVAVNFLVLLLLLDKISFIQENVKHSKTIQHPLVIRLFSEKRGEISLDAFHTMLHEHTEAKER